MEEGVSGDLPPPPSPARRKHWLSANPLRHWWTPSSPDGGRAYACARAHREGTSSYRMSDMPSISRISAQHFVYWISRAKNAQPCFSMVAPFRSAFSGTKQDLQHAIAVAEIGFTLTGEMQNGDHRELEQSLSSVLAEDIAAMWNIPLSIEPPCLHSPHSLFCSSVCFAPSCWPSALDFHRKIPSVSCRLSPCYPLRALIHVFLSHRHRRLTSVYRRFLAPWSGYCTCGDDRRSHHCTLSS